MKLFRTTRDVTFGTLYYTAAGYAVAKATVGIFQTMIAMFR